MSAAAKTTQDVAALIREDCRNDVARLDGALVTGRAIGELCGQLYAICDALAREVARLADRLDGLERV